MKFFHYVRSYIQWLLFGLTLTFYVFIFFIIGWALGKNQMEWLIRKFVGQMILVSGIDLHVHGLENVDPGKAYVVICNHFNFLDHFVIYHALKIRLRGLEKEAHFSWPVYGSLMKLVGIIPIPPRGNTEKAMQSLEIAKKKIREGYSMLVAPEGTRSIDGKLGRFKKGGFFLAIQTQADILPVMFRGMYEFNQKGSKLLNPRRVDLYIEKPIPTKSLTENDVTQLRNQVYDLYKKFEAQAN